MSKTQIIEALKEVIINNSNLEADPDDIVMFTGVSSVSGSDDGVRIDFNDGHVLLKVV